MSACNAVRAGAPAYACSPCGSTAQEQSQHAFCAYTDQHIAQSSPDSCSGHSTESSLPAAASRLRAATKRQRSSSRRVGSQAVEGGVRPESQQAVRVLGAVHRTVLVYAPCFALASESFARDNHPGATKPRGQPNSALAQWLLLRYLHRISYNLQEAAMTVEEYCKRALLT